MTVENEHTAFPPWPSLTQDATLQNLNSFSWHSYGKYGYALSEQTGDNLTESVAWARPRPLPSGVPVLGFATTEHNTHTTKLYDTLSTTPGAEP